MTKIVVGYDGMLGAAVCRSLRSGGALPVTPDICWGNPQALADLRDAFDQATTNGEPWQLYWCAGAGITSSSAQVFEEELETFARFCAHVADSGKAPDGTFFFASSAGAIYAGSTERPCTEATPPVPLAPYGHAKLALEGVAGELAEAGVRVVIGRISNLYGPGQSLDKPQGLISHLCLALQTRKPLGIYVSLDTLRDYIYVDDAAGLIVDMANRATGLPNDRGPWMKIVATGSSTSIAELLGTLKLIARRRIPVILSASSLARHQVADLRMRSDVWPDLDHRPVTPLPAGIANCLADVSLRWRQRAT